MKTVNRHIWGVSAVVFGGWEAIAYGTRKVPTVSCLVHKALGRRHRRIAQALVIGYAAGLSKHLLTPDP